MLDVATAQTFRLPFSCPRCGENVFRNGTDHGTSSRVHNAWVDSVCIVCGLIYEFDAWYVECGGDEFDPERPGDLTWRPSDVEN
jgi:transcription elongation factor Elf1